jgi:hypothetical protein
MINFTYYTFKRSNNKYYHKQCQHVCNAENDMYPTKYCRQENVKVSHVQTHINQGIRYSEMIREENGFAGIWQI